MVYRIAVKLIYYFLAFSGL